MTTTVNHLDDTRHHAGAMDNSKPADPEVPSARQGAGASRASTRRRYSPSTTLSIGGAWKGRAQLAGQHPRRLLGSALFFRVEAKGAVPFSHPLDSLDVVP